MKPLISGRNSLLAVGSPPNQKLTKQFPNYSRTTSRHINNYLDGVKAVDMHQDHFDKFFG
jgi:hypothetical protein